MRRFDATARFNAICLARAALHGTATAGFFRLSRFFLDASMGVPDDSPAGRVATACCLIAGATALHAIAGIGENMRLIADRRDMTADP